MSLSTATNETDLAFEPDGMRAARLDRQIRADLAQSLEHLSSRCQGLIPFDSEALERLIQGLKDGKRYPPAAFGLYSHLVFALLRDDRKSAVDLFAQLTRMEPQTMRSDVLSLDDPRLTPHHQQLLSLMDLAADDGAALGPCDPQALTSFLSDYRWAMERMECDLPELAAEIDAMVAQLILVWIPDRKDRLIFDGGSSPMLWGGMFINGARQRTPLELLEVLVHESAHLLLYAFTQHEPLLLNDEAERYPSPLRADPRPMEGIFHATWVSARMSYAMDILSRSPHLSTTSRQQASAAMQTDRMNFEAGYEVIRAHASLTTTGQRLIDAAATRLGYPMLSQPARL